MQSDLSEENEYAKNLFNNNYMPGPGICSCNSTNFKIYKDSHCKINQISFRCSNNKCRKKNIKLLLILFIINLTIKI